MKEYYVYIICCADGSYYTGVTNDFDKRFAEHEESLDPQCYTFNRRPLELVFVQSFVNVKDAIIREKQIKKWSKAKKKALIEKDYDSLERLSRNSNYNDYMEKKSEDALRQAQGDKQKQAQSDKQKQAQGDKQKQAQSDKQKQAQGDRQKQAQGDKQKQAQSDKQKQAQGDKQKQAQGDKQKQAQGDKKIS